MRAFQQNLNPAQEPNRSDPIITAKFNGLSFLIGLFIGVLIVLLLTSCNSIPPIIIEPPPEQITEALPTRTAASTPTRELTPTPTTGYKETAQAAQMIANTAIARADAASRLMVDATMSAEQIELDQARMTEGAEIRAFTLYMGSATAASTSIPATQTERAFQKVIAVGKLMQSAAMMTATANAPNMRRAEIYADYYPTELIVKNIFVILVGLAVVLAFGYLFVTASLQAWRAKRASELAERSESTTWGYEAREQDFGQVCKFKMGERVWQDVIPADTTMLLELGDRVLLGESLAINKWEGRGTSWTRGSFLLLLIFLSNNKLAISPSEKSNSSHRLTNEGKRFLRECVRCNAPPPLFTFLHDVAQATDDDSHMALTHELFAGGEVDAQ